MADPVYPIYPAQEETAAVQKYLADKRAYDALAAQLPAIERKIAAQQKIAETGMASRPGFATEDIFGLARPVYNADQQWKAVQAIRGLEASRAEIQNAPKPDLGAVESAIRSTTPPELPPGVQEIVDGGTQKPQATVAPSAPAQPAPAPEKPKYDPFAEFNNYEKTRKKFFSIAFKYVSQVPIQYQDEALKLVKEEWDNTGPSLPKSTLLPLKHPATGEILKDQALTADGRIVELKAPPAEKALTEAQEKNLKFAGAMHRANKEYENLVRASGYDPANPLNRLPMFEMLKTQNRKLYEGIVNEFTNAINRDQSGASVTPAEFQAAERRYFPLAGDTEEVLKAKEARRKEMVASMYDLVPESARDKIPSYGTNQQQQSAPGAGGGFYFNTKTGRMEPR